MHDSTTEAYAYAILWLIGALASLASTLNDPNYRASWRLCGAIGCGGFLGVATVGVLSAGNDSGFASSGYAYGVASLAGLLGKNSDQWIRWLSAKVAKIQLPPDKKEPPE